MQPGCSLRRPGQQRPRAALEPPPWPLQTGLKQTPNQTFPRAKGVTFGPSASPCRHLAVSPSRLLFGLCENPAALSASVL